MKQQIKRLVQMMPVCALALTTATLTTACQPGHNNGKTADKADTITNYYNQKARPLAELQQNFVDLRFGMFIHYNIPTYSDQDWPDPQTPASVFNPQRLDCNQWADAALSANMTYGCLTTKHHSGFCIWDTKTTDYNVMNSPLKRDVVREYVDAFRQKGLHVMLYYSILDTHHNIRKGWVDKRKHTDFVKAQLTELLTNYGEIEALIIDGWEAWWSRIGYDEVLFEEIYHHVKSIQPNCLVSDHNCDKYPASELFYGDIKHYEQNAGQFISRETNQLPAAAGLPINKNWFWKTSFPDQPVKSAEFIVNENLIPLNDAHCNFILNVAPNRDGRIDDNAMAELKRIGKLWKYPGKAPALTVEKKPIITINKAKHRPMTSSWAFDTKTCDYAADDNFNTYWTAYEAIKEPFIEVALPKDTKVNAIGFAETADVEFYDKASDTRIGDYRISYLTAENKWKQVELKPSVDFVRIHHLAQPIHTSQIRISFTPLRKGLSIAEVLVY